MGVLLVVIECKMEKGRLFWWEEEEEKGKGVRVVDEEMPRIFILMVGGKEK
jgi:hypothetical protein